MMSAMRKATIPLLMAICSAVPNLGAQDRPSISIRDKGPDTVAPASAVEWDPLKAQKDIEVGSYYLRRGSYDAALERFQEAAKLHPGLALPHLKLGETYEKKKDLPMAVASYRKYLDLYKSAPDGSSVRKRIEQLEKQIARDSDAHETHK
jgi:tetratricopeptide (TPR) repeat protein